MARQIQWVSADGVSIGLNDRGQGYRVLDRTTGLTSPAYDLVSSRYAGQDGAGVDAIAALPREINLAMLVQGSTRAEFRGRVASLVRAMRPKAGPGTLVVLDEDGRTRRLPCYYRGGLEGTEARGEKLADRWWKASIQLFAPSPWWEGSEVAVSFGLAAPSVFLSPTLPMPRALSSSSIQGQRTIDLSDSDAESYPLWTITGPGSVLTLSNNTTGQVIQVNAALGDGQTMVIDTRPGFQSVRRGDLPPSDPAWNLGGSLASDPALWPLVEGMNTVTATLGGAGTNSRIDGVYRPRYAGA